MPFNKLIGDAGFQSPQRIDEGGCGHSFKAFDPKLKRDVFIKYYPTEDGYDERILSEPRKIAALFSDDGHAPDYIASIYSANERMHDGDRYIEMVTEFCSGESLYKYLQTSSLFISEALEFGKQIIDGLHVLHNKRVLHRDIKPSNLVISGEKIKIIDLGGATELATGQMYLVSPSKHSIYYRPPEAFPPSNIYGMFSDIYQVALVIYEMINGPISEDVSNFLVPKIINAEERALGKSYSDMASYEQSDVQDKCIKHLAEKSLLLNQARAPKRLYKSRINTIINNLAHPDYGKRISLCSQARIKLSSYTGANWKEDQTGLITIRNYRGRDYFAREYLSNKSKLMFECLNSKTGDSKTRKNNEIASWEALETFLGL